MSSTQDTGLPFPAAIFNLCQEMLDNPGVLQDAADKTNPSNYRGTVDAFGGRVPPLPPAPVEEWRKLHQIQNPMPMPNAEEEGPVRLHF